MRKLILAAAFVLVAIPGCGSAAAMHSQSTTTAASVDRSQHVQRSIDADTNLTVGLNGAYPGATVTQGATQCVQSTGTQTYACIVHYSVSGSPTDPALLSIRFGNYQLGAHATCDAHGGCQYQTDALGSASVAGY
jgi:hypothetical protein